MILKLEIELEYDENIMHGNDAGEVEWFRENVLFSPCEAEPLTLHSGCIGDEVGKVTVTKIISWSSNAEAIYAKDDKNQPTTQINELTP